MSDEKEQSIVAHTVEPFLKAADQARRATGRMPSVTVEVDDATFDRIAAESTDGLLYGKIDSIQWWQGVAVVRAGTHRPADAGPGSSSVDEASQRIIAALRSALFEVLDGLDMNPARRTELRRLACDPAAVIEPRP